MASAGFQGALFAGASADCCLAAAELFSVSLLHLLQAMFSRPLPELSCRLNAFVTALTCTWLMGPCEVNDVETADGKIAKGQGVLVERSAHFGSTAHSLGKLEEIFGKDALGKLIILQMSISGGEWLCIDLHQQLQGADSGELTQIQFSGTICKLLAYQQPATFLIVTVSCS